MAMPSPVSVSSAHLDLTDAQPHVADPTTSRVLAETASRMTLVMVDLSA
jgi:hypothetical protein